MAAIRRRRRVHIEAPHRLDDVGLTLSPDAIHQMTSAITAVAMRTGASINATDPQLLQAIARFIGTSGMAQLARGDTAMLGMVSRFVEQHAAVIAQHQRERDAQNPARPDAEAPGSGESLTARLLRQGAFGRFDAQTGTPPPSYSDLPGNASNVSPAEIIRLNDRWGMNGDTARWLNRQGFEFRHIQAAAQYADRLGFRGRINDRRIMRNLSIIHRDGVDPDRLVGSIEELQRALAADQAFRAAVLRRDAAPEGSEARRQAQAEIDRIVAQHSARGNGPSGSVTENLDRQTNAAVAAAARETLRDAVGQAEARVQNGAGLGFGSSKAPAPLTPPPGQLPPPVAGPGETTVAYQDPGTLNKQPVNKQPDKQPVTKQPATKQALSKQAAELGM